MAERTTGPELAAETIQSESSIGNRLDDAVGQRDPEKQNKPAHPDEPGTEVGNDPLLTSEYLGDPMCYHPNTSDPAEASFNAQPITPSCSRNEPTAVGLIGRTGADDMRDSAFNSREHFSLQELKTCATPRRAPAMVDSESVGVSVGDVGDFGDDIRDLKNRLDGLMILTESKSHSTSDDSAGEENTSLSSFGSPVSSPRIREHACGHRNSGGSPIQSTAAPPESGGLSGQYNGRSDGDDDEGEHRHGVQDNGTSSSSSQSSKSKRYPRHLESHNFFMCSKCLTKFNTKEQKSMHDKMRACVKICTNGACKRHTMDFETPSTSCNCLMTSDDLWAATFRQAFPHLPLPAPWSSKVQSWLVPPVQSMQQEPWIQTYCQSQPWSYPENLPADMTAQDGFDLQAMMDYNVDSELPAPGFHNAIPTANTPLNLDGGNDLHAAFPNTNPTRHPANTSANHTAQSVSHTDIQKLREQVAILEQRVERPSRSEQKESAMLRLAWNRLIEIGDQSVQEGGVLRQVASMLTPQLIEDGKKDSNAAQPMEMSNVMDWDAAGLGPQNLGPGGKGKQRAVSGAEDSAYCSGMQMG
ncbi:hypothetical protein PRZ48_013781 [Zasmidium cellare]|uniref:C2H2-type domain-containing protein n=1 Tax=Zasmidium cellare TaxID=395010 RepID=A0ABR0E221_ZASCE|nr:hypothetical protein PRZ48_013781 [Zasmidium cellare]